jgi:hypothetical protein
MFPALKSHFTDAQTPCFYESFLEKLERFGPKLFRLKIMNAGKIDRVQFLCFNEAENIDCM